MKNLPRVTSLLGVLLLVVLAAGLSAAASRAQDDDPFLLKQGPELSADWQRDTLDAPTAELPIKTLPSLTRFRVPLPEVPHLQAVETPDADCYQLLANARFDIVEFGDGTGSAEPWVVLSPAIYYFTDTYVSSAYSLGMADGDEEPGEEYDIDAFGQGFFMPSGLESVVVAYNHAVVNQDAWDEVYGFLWSLDQDGYLNEVLFAWEVGQPEFDLDWRGRYVEIVDSAVLAPMDGAVMAMTFFTYGDQLPPLEYAIFDDVTVTACVQRGPGQLFLPSVMAPISQVIVPVCVPPNEMPQDQYNANRGLVQTGAACNSTLSNIDRADYYTFKPTQSGAHTLHLHDLPAGTEWSAMIFLDQANPDYAPGPTTGQCRIGTPGSDDKSVTCVLDQNTDYFVKVSAGSTYAGPVGQYGMQIVGP